MPVTSPYMGALLLAALMTQTASFRLLGGPPTFLAAAAIVAYVLLRQAPIRYRSSPVTTFMFWSTVAAALFFAHGLLGGERYLWTLSARLFFVGVFFLALQGAFEDSDPKAVLRLFASVLFWLCVVNAAVFVVFVATGLPPLFTRVLGELHPRTYQHYILTATEDGLRFISFFDEPSDLAWLGCTAMFILVAQGERRRAAILAVCLLVSLSASLPFVYGMLLVYAGGPWLLVVLGVVALAALNLDSIFAYAASTPILDMLAIRYFTDEGRFRLSRSDHFAEFFDEFALIPHSLDERGVDAALNGSLILLLRYGMVYLPMFIWFWMIVATYLWRTWRANRALAFALATFAVSFMAHESALFNCLFWIPFEAIRRIVDSESPALVPAAVPEGAAGAEGREGAT